MGRWRAGAVAVACATLALSACSSATKRATLPTTTTSAENASTQLPADLLIERTSKPGGGVFSWVRMDRNGIEHRLPFGGEPAGLVHWSPDGTQVYATVSGKRGTALTIERPDGSDRRVITSGQTGDYDATWSPARDEIAFVRVERQGGPQSLYLIQVDGHGLRRLTTPPAGEYDYFPHFSPDGSTIAFLRGRSGDHVALWVVRRDGSDAHMRSLSAPWINESAWSPDGRALAVALSTNTYGTLWLLHDGASPRALASSSDGAIGLPDWSPDGRSIVYQQGDGVHGGLDLYVVRVDTGAIKRLTRTPLNDRTAVWSPGGTAIAYECRARPTFTGRICVMDVRTGRERYVTNHSWGEEAPQWRPSPGA